MLKFVAAAFALVVAFAAAPASAQSAKNAVQVSRGTLIPRTQNAPWQTILSNTIRTSQQKDLIMTVSLETGLYTDTTVVSRNGNRVSSSAEAIIEVRVLVDGNEVQPGPVIFDRRKQTLIASFGGILQDCTDLNGDGTLDGYTECTWTDEELQLILDTMSAHSFQFAMDNMGSGIHTVQVQARVDTAASSDGGLSNASAIVGKGALTVEEVRLVQNADIVL